MIRKLIFVLPLLAALWSCDNKEKERLQAKVDSLQTALEVSKQTEQQLTEVGALIDSIDASRQLLRTDVVEGTSYTDYKNRLVNINSYIRETQGKIDELEKTAKNNRALSATIKRLRNELQMSTEQIAALQQEVEKMRTENTALARNVSERDSVISLNTETIKMREQDISALETKVTEINAKARSEQADLYFAQAQALETAASRTKFAPKKKKETMREALELYKLSLSLGKQEAQEKISELEKEIS